MKTSMLLGLCLLGFGCGGGGLEIGRDQTPTNPAMPEVPAPTTHPNPVQAANASLENGLPYDGCTWLIRLDGDEQNTYGPDEASVKLVEAFAGDKIGETRAALEYEKTGDQVDIECGWGGKTSVDALRIIAIGTP